ncbi:membrane protein insertase YidC [Roseobacter sp. HKCCD9010]|uniref:membrane protein insertase YidC n=1 Tax=unclassified Roseobacter TaxID=196798 RepID=UPI0014929070|nr:MULTISPECIES: membrane protein insertase YidC [unclassified Roseobacter]MBF9051656.1 membrane protein insertase YidC [Rhodobacterales bacterium HKCCD4356]NNV13180.1 membrane protein insertase YidC [Roseobacter sp. HKCCD7357]NNV17431.1 membrane protein insertase YidC [Roseobacter sp. HKCCD8768]NNV27037.1 membrane protein insertase YidC [Roseobacter sp. HKCCD8192]NNV31157.1 membrane protein insertase YidC [Roseobacter sp. HKCCD9061]
MDDQNRNLILATALSFLVILVWFLLFPPPDPTVTDTTDTPAVTVLDENGTEMALTPPVADAGDAPQLATDAETRATILAEAERITIETPAVSGSISLVGGRIDDLSLNNYFETLEEDSPTVTLLSPVGESEAYYALYGWAPAGDLAFEDVPGANTEWQIESGETLTPETPVTLVWDNGNGLIFRRSIAIDEDFMFQVTQSVENTTDASARMAPYGIVARHGLPSDLQNFFILHEGVVRKSDGTLDELAYDDLPDLDFIQREGTPAEVVDVAENGWIGFTDKYWMTTLIPGEAQPFTSVTRYVQSSDIYQTEARLPTMTVAPGETAEISTQLFAGAKEWETIRNYQNEGGIARFLDSIDWGWFYFLTKPIFWLLHNLNALIGNMGVAIIALTLIIKALLLPLAFKSYVSMAKMKELQPEMEKLKERAGDDRQKLQQGMMELYKTNKVNPASGCLPILLQIPIFFSLYKVIFVTLELRHAPFFGWLTDLSMPDPSSIYNFYGLLPWAAPEPGTIMALLFIGILPLLLGISMWLQQKLNPAPTDPTQAMIFAYLPWVFMFMLGSFASGLLVYWIANNTITFVQQYTIMRSQGFKPDVFGNIRSGFQRKKSDEK